MRRLVSFLGLVLALAAAVPASSLHAQRTASRADVLRLSRDVDSLVKVDRALARREHELEARAVALRFAGDSTDAAAQGWTLMRGARTSSTPTPAPRISSRLVLGLGAGVVALNASCTSLLCDRDRWRGPRPMADAYTAAHVGLSAALTSAQIAAGISPARAAVTAIALGAGYEASQGHVDPGDLAYNTASAAGTALLLHWLRRD